MIPAAMPAAAALITDEQLSHVLPLAMLIAGAVLLGYFMWRDRGKPWLSDEQDVDLRWAPDLAPPTAPELASLEGLRRTADRG